MSQDRFRVLFDRSSDPHIIFDATGITDCNEAMIRLLGAPDKGRVLSLHPAALSPEFQPDGRRSAEKSAEMDRITRERGHHRFEWVHRRLDGQEVPVEVAMSAVKLDGGPAMVVVWHDLTARKRAENDLLRLGEDLQEANGRLASANLRMKRDLDAAARVQQSLLPRALPVMAGARFAWTYRPCTELAGDILNVFRLDDRDVGLYVLDVSGHGAVASLLSVAASHLISPVGDSGLLRRPHEAAGSGVRLAPPPEVATKLNAVFAGRDDSEQFFTLLYGILNLDTSEFRYVCGGHPGPIHAPLGGDPRLVETTGFPDRLYIHGLTKPRTQILCSTCSPFLRRYRSDRALRCPGKDRSARTSRSILRASRSPAASASTSQILIYRAPTSSGSRHSLAEMIILIGISLPRRECRRASDTRIWLFKVEYAISSRKGIF